MSGTSVEERSVTFGMSVDDAAAVVIALRHDATFHYGSPAAKRQRRIADALHDELHRGGHWPKRETV